MDQQYDYLSTYTTQPDSTVVNNIVCVFGGLSSFYIWMEGLCVVGWWGGGGGSGFFSSSSFIASMLYIRFSCKNQAI